MAVQIEVVHTVVTTAGTTQDILVSGAGTPVGALIFWSAETADGPASPSADMVLGMGATDFTREWCCSHVTENASDPSQCVSHTAQTFFIAIPAGNGLSIEMDATASTITDGLQLNWGSTPGTAYRIMVVLFYGTDSVCEAGVVVSNTTLVDTGSTVTFTDMPEEPEVIWFGSTLAGTFNNGFTVDALLSIGFGSGPTASILQGCQGYNDDDGRNPAGRHSQHTRDNRVVVCPSYSSTSELTSLELTATGVNGTPRGTFEFTKRQASTTHSFGWFAFSSKGNNQYDIAVPVLDTNLIGVKSYTTPGFRPQFSMMLPGNLPSVNVGNNGNNAAGIGVSAWDEGEAAGHYSGHSSEADPALSGSYYESVVMNQRAHGGGVSFRATTPAMTASGFDFTMTTASAVDKAIPILCIEENTAAGIDLTPGPATATAAAPAVLLDLLLFPDASVATAAAPAAQLEMRYAQDAGVVAAQAPAVLLDLLLFPDASVAVAAAPAAQLEMRYAQDAATVNAAAPVISIAFALVLLPGPSIVTAKVPPVRHILTMHPGPSMASTVAPALLLALTLHPAAAVANAAAPVVAISFGIVLSPGPSIATAAAPALLLALTLHPAPSTSAALAPAPQLEMAYAQAAAVVNAAAPAMALNFGIVLSPGPSIAMAAAPAVLLAPTLFPAPSIASAVAPAPVLEMRFAQDAAVVATQAAAPQLEMRFAQAAAVAAAQAPVVALGGDTVLLPGPALLTATAPIPSLLGLGIRIEAGPAAVSAVAKSPLLDLPWLEVVEFDLMICRMLEPDLLVTREMAPDLLITRLLEESLER